MENITIQKIIFLINETGKKQKELTDFLGITQNAFTDWKSGRIKSYTKHLPKIAEFFGVSVDYLLGVEDEKKPPEKDDLPEGLEDLAELYAKLTPEMRETMAALLSSLGELPEDRQQFVVQAVRLALGRQ